MRIRPVGAEFFHAGEHMDWHDEVISRFSQFCERAWKLQTGLRGIQILLNYLILNTDVLNSSATYWTIYQSTER